MAMTAREKFLSVMRMEPGEYPAEVKVPKAEFGYWAGTIRAWFDQGLEMRDPVPEDYSDGIAIMANRNIGKDMEKAGDRNVQPVFDLEPYLTKFPVDYSPMFDEEIIEKTDTHVLYRDAYGVLCKNDARMRSLPMELENPVKDWNSWNEYKEYYDLSTIEKRLPPGWDSIAERLKDRDFPIRLGGTVGGFLGFPRQIMGVTGYLMALYDQPDMIHDMCDTFLQFLLHYYDRILRDVKVDCILIWEDMAGKQGSLISPDHFREFLSSRYKQMVGFALESGVDIILTDSDGYVEDLIPLIAETGVTGMYPFERAAGNDLLRIREAFPEFQILGGFDKRALFSTGGKQAIDEELEIIKELLKKGRYIPHLDHFASPDCTWENFSYYRKKLNAIIDSFNEKKG